MVNGVAIMHANVTLTVSVVVIVVLIEIYPAEQRYRWNSNTGRRQVPIVEHFHFDKLPQAVTEKKIAQMRFESTEDEPNLFGIGTFQLIIYRIYSLID